KGGRPPSFLRVFPASASIFGSGLSGRSATWNGDGRRRFAHFVVLSLFPHRFLGLVDVESWKRGMRRGVGRRAFRRAFPLFTSVLVGGGCGKWEKRKEEVGRAAGIWGVFSASSHS